MTDAQTIWSDRGHPELKKMAEGVLKKETPAQVLVPVRASPVASVDLLKLTIVFSSMRPKAAFSAPDRLASYARRSANCDGSFW